MKKRRAKMQIHLSRADMLLLIALAGMAFCFTTKAFLNFMAGLSPVEGFLIYYTILFTSLYALAKVGLAIKHREIVLTTQVIGLTMVTFAFFAIVNWENPYVQYTTTGSFAGASGAFYGTEDATLWQFWSSIIPATSPANIELLRWLALIISPIVIALVGLVLVIGRVRLTI